MPSTRHLFAAALCFAASLAFAAPPPAPGGADQLGGQLSADGRTVGFRVFSQHATRIEVWLYRRAHGAPQVARHPLARVGTTPVWQVTLPAATLRRQGFDIAPNDATKLFTNVHYGLRAWGPNWPFDARWAPGSAAGFVTDVDSEGHRFNPNKLLLDPYALEVSHDYLSAAVQPPLADSALYASGGASTLPGTPDRQRDSGRFAPKGRVAMPFGRGFASLNAGSAPTRPAKDDIIYEAHVRGLTQGNASVGACRGTYAGAAAKIPELTRLGINTIEFMPIQETDNEANDLADAATQRSPASTRGDNYWGYMTANYFAPDRRYACDKSSGGPTREFVAMVRAFHTAGIKVLTDVVYNHSGEGGVWSPAEPAKANLWSFRGLDNASYYLLTRAPGAASDRHFYFDVTGTGNTLNSRHPRVRQLIVDSLTYQRRVLGVDGFRFDLGIALANGYDNDTNPADPQRFHFDRSSPDTALAGVVAALPGVSLASEPWGLAGDEGYQLGRMPVGISEWNGGFRDVLRRTLNGYGVRDAEATRGAIAERIDGSKDLFGDAGDGRGKPWYSVNFVNVHDGYTLKDVFSCNGQNTVQAWPLGPSDGGSAQEDQWDNGGDAAQQRQQARTAFGLLMLAAGVPIFNAGDEFLRSLNCNNNTYNVDSPGTWLNWTLTPEQANFRAFASGMVALRKAQPALRPDDFYAAGALDWFGADKSLRTQSPDAGFWQATPAAPDASGQNRTLAWRYAPQSGGDGLLVLFNGEPVQRDFTLPAPGAGRNTWCRVTDTAAWAEGPSQVDLAAGTCVGGEDAHYGVHGRSLVVLLAR